MLDELWTLVARIPHGKVCAYGELGRALSQPVSGFQVGRWMAQAPADIPWWRVVSKLGGLPVHKKSVEAAMEQRQLLQSEGVQFDELGQVVMAETAWQFD